MKNTFFCLTVLMAAPVLADAPSITAASLMQNPTTRLVTVDYTLAGTSAVVTVDFQTNGVTIGEANFADVEGDVNCLVTTTGSHRLTWNPASDGSSFDFAALRAVVTAWDVSRPPPYMVVELGATNVPVRYYVSTNALPGGLLENPVYRTSSIVMRRIDAKNVTWMMGRGDDAFSVTLDDDYYIGVFELTQGQYLSVMSSYISSYFSRGDCREMRPVEQINYGGHIRGWQSNYWPNPPDPAMLIGQMRKRTGVDFDLPGESQWEYACRAGHYGDLLNDGSSIAEGNLNRLARWRGNGFVNGSAAPADTLPDDGGTAIVGSYAPNSWGLYDMHGNVWEWVLDGYDSTIKNYGGKINISSEDNTLTYGGNGVSSRVRRGGSWRDTMLDCRASSRYSAAQSQYFDYLGLRLVCPVTAKRGN